MPCMEVSLKTNDTIFQFCISVNHLFNIMTNTLLNQQQDTSSFMNQTSHVISKGIW